MTKPSTDLISVAVWDVFVRVFHWSLVLLFCFSVISAKVGGNWITWHMYSGYAILSLVIFRLMWGFVGGEYARFSSFIAGPVRAARFAVGLLKRGSQHSVGHNPVGGWMVIVLLLLLTLQAGLGLFGNDEIATTGPLARYVSDDASIKAMSWHRRIGDALLILVAIHILAVLFHVFVKKEGLIRAMLSGKKSLPRALAESTANPRAARNGLGLFLIGFAVVLVAVVVNWPSIFKN
ncbi:MAG: cytochrome B [Betaproteobacteria bacterium]|nr:MAG: cytochrome B [Betaproteobacteria bacterium]